MRIVVCVKQVQSLGDEVEFTQDGRDVDPDFLEPALNEWDTYATEEALRIKECLGGEPEVVVVTCGGSETEAVLRRCLAMGADRALRVEGSPGVDPIAVARALAPVVRDLEPELVFCGVQSSDSVQGATGVALAELLDLPRVAVVIAIEFDQPGRRAVVKRELEAGLISITEVDTPALLTIQTGINEPRYANLRRIKLAEQQEIEIRQTGEAASPAFIVRRMFVPPRGGAAMLDGGAAEIAGRIAQILEERLA